MLPIPDDARLAWLRQNYGSAYALVFQFPRSEWLRDFETILREHYPQANSDSLTLTARHAAPFPLAQGPNVP